MLFARLQGHAVGGVAAGVLGDADDAAGHRADVGFAGGEESRMWATEAHRHAKALSRTQGDVGTEAAGALQQHQCHQVGGDGNHCTARFQRGDRCLQVGDGAVDVGILQQRAENIMLACIRGAAKDQFITEVSGAGAHHIDGLREAGLVDEERVGLGSGDPAGHRHGFGRRGGFVEQ
ncbi:hypothetical protein SDC9_164793 [bioreactor metagenome]|uniref:Uncharacterized protein n=1 Tax=bioreactor metagenome TaxID=1076179 RepID=A0A645FUL2_9ZZZZ